MPRNVIDEIFADADRGISGKGVRGKTKRPKTRTKCPPTLKRAIRQRWWGNKLIGNCFCCGRKNLHYDDADVGHIKARASGGDWSPDNNRLICRNCNGGMGKTNMRVYMKKNFPERYAKFFALKDKLSTKKKITKKKTAKKKRKKKSKRPKTPFERIDEETANAWRNL